MKRFEDFTKEDLWDLRQQIVLNSLFVSDYRNNMGIDEHSVADFFEGYMDYLTELEREEGMSDETFKQFFDRYDTPDNLWSWYHCHGDFDWVKYAQEEED